MTPEDLGLPVESWRPGQEELVCSLAQHFQTGGTVAALEAPPGTGKSIIGAGVARLLQWKLLVVTATKQLQDQYTATFPDMADLRGRGNYPCKLEHNQVSADLGACTMGAPCEYMYTDTGQPEGIGCAYYRARGIVQQKAREAVTSYSYWLRTQVGEGNPFENIVQHGLVVCDEAHFLEKALKEAAALSIAWRVLVALKLSEPPETMSALSCWLQSAGERAADWLSSRQQYLTKWAAVPPAVRWLCTTMLDLRVRAPKIVEALERQPNSWIRSTERAGLGAQDLTTIKPVGLGPEVLSSLWSRGKRFLLMSGTLSQVLLDELLLKDTIVASAPPALRVSVPSPFPAWSRPIFFQGVSSVTKQRSPHDEEKLVRAVDHICGTYPDSRGVVHTGNYEVMKLLREHSHYRARFITHNSVDRADKIKEFLSSTGAILVSPSATTGLDLPYDLCRFQIIAKVPWPSLGDPQVKARMNRTGGRRWYMAQAAQEIAQAYGRGVRAADDSCVLYILDSTFERLHSWSELWPPWFREAVHMLD